MAGYTFNSANGIGLTGTATLASLGGKLTASGYCAAPATDTVTFSLGFTPTIVVMNRVASGRRFVSITSTVSTIY
jgi:ABC-type nitrate/sulfonate/bicarbonate transport system substrate-binding protein